MTITEFLTKLCIPKNMTYTLPKVPGPDGFTSEFFKVSRNSKLP